MPEQAGAASPNLFFLIGPLRTGSSLAARCVDDHPSVICLCESEINRALFDDYIVEHHSQRMRAHGFDLEATIRLLDRKKQNDVASLMNWYLGTFNPLRKLYQKPEASMLGDKSPDFAQSPKLVEHLAANFPLIYTVRDPRAILASIEVQNDATPEEKAERWTLLAQNYLAWKPHLDAPNVLSVRYEDLVSRPAPTMQAVYHHLGLPDSTRFLESFPRPCPGRFLWSTNVDFNTGLSKEFDASRLDSWKSKLTGDQLDRVRHDSVAAEFMERFGYG